MHLMHGVLLELNFCKSFLFFNAECDLSAGCTAQSHLIQNLHGYPQFEAQSKKADFDNSSTITVGINMFNNCFSNLIVYQI